MIRCLSYFYYFSLLIHCKVIRYHPIRINEPNRVVQTVRVRTPPSHLFGKWVYDIPPADQGVTSPEARQVPPCSVIILTSKLALEFLAIVKVTVFRCSRKGFTQAKRIIVLLLYHRKAAAERTLPRWSMRWCSMYPLD